MNGRQIAPITRPTGRFAASRPNSFLTRCHCWSGRLRLGVEINSNRPRLRMSAPRNRSRWILCDRSLFWAQAIRSALRFDPKVGRARGRDLESRLLVIAGHDACLAELQKRPASFVTLGVDDDNFADCLDMTDKVRQRFRRAKVTIVSSCHDTATEWQSRCLVFREAGAAMAIRNIWGLTSLAVWAQTHLASLPAEKTSIEDQISDSLPWHST